MPNLHIPLVFYPKFRYVALIVSRKRQVAQLSIHPIMSTERNSVVLRNAALGTLVALALFVYILNVMDL